jgi:hypothetical protein
MNLRHHLERTGSILIPKKHRPRSLASIAQLPLFHHPLRNYPHPQQWLADEPVFLFRLLWLGTICLTSSNAPGNGSSGPINHPVPITDYFGVYKTLMCPRVPLTGLHNDNPFAHPSHRALRLEYPVRSSVRPPSSYNINIPRKGNCDSVAFMRLPLALWPCSIQLPPATHPQRRRHLCFFFI